MPIDNNDLSSRFRRAAWETSPMDVAETRYAMSGDVSIAYQVVGTGPARSRARAGVRLERPSSPGDDPNSVTFYPRARRVLTVDRVRQARHGTVPITLTASLSLEVRMDDLHAVMNAAGSERSRDHRILRGSSNDGALRRHIPGAQSERSSSCWRNRTIHADPAPDYPFGPSAAEYRLGVEETRARWGTPAYADEALAALAPSMVGDAEYRVFFGRYMRQSASPGAAAALEEMNGEIDIRAVLPRFAFRLLQCVARGTALELGRYLSDRIPGARFVELNAQTISMWTGDQMEIVDRIREFISSIGEGPGAHDDDDMDTAANWASSPTS